MGNHSRVVISSVQLIYTFFFLTVMNIAWWSLKPQRTSNLNVWHTGLHDFYEPCQFLKWLSVYSSDFSIWWLKLHLIYTLLSRITQFCFLTHMWHWWSKYQVCICTKGHSICIFKLVFNNLEILNQIGKCSWRMSLL